MPRKTPQSDLIGCNLRPGQTRGGFTNQQSPGAKRSHHSDGFREIKEAASVCLEKRGFVRNPSPWHEGEFRIGVREKREDAP